MVRSTDFRSTVRHGRRIGGMTMVVHAARRAADASPDAPVLIGFVVSKSVGNAVARNRVKRRLRHLVSDRIRPAVPTQGTSALPGGTRLVLRALPAAAGTPHRLDQDFARAWDRVLQTVSV